MVLGKARVNRSTSARGVWAAHGTKPRDVAVVGNAGNIYELNWQERSGTLTTTGEFFYTSRQLLISRGTEPNMLQTFTIGVTFNPPENWWTIDCRPPTP